MIAGVKKCIDTGDIKALRYIFLDSLDIDPTFEKYEEDYNICKNLKGMFEPYIELTPLSKIHSDWNIDYWVKIKFDQKKNFSEKRFNHMKEVAKVVYSQKIERLQAERKAKKIGFENQNEQIISNSISSSTNKSDNTQIIQDKQDSISFSKANNLSSEKIISESDMSRLEAKKREIELHNQKVQYDELKRRHQREKTIKQIEDNNSMLEDSKSSKKVLGIVVVTIVILIVVVVFLLKVQ
ncbi:MAG: hypothetical protein HFF36_10300 [Coprobacillus sp.]|jgi:hypothetical protein|uniref:hypothetical protein n=1 Tax=Thomasclavelia cocleata TaxID=69824 RepID=UPI00217331A3|nr:hypothetical protein [Thomasclavelia cocleata]MCI9094155.1 hypothetical protein [Coprobacillus sp.]